MMDYKEVTYLTRRLRGVDDNTRMRILLLIAESPGITHGAICDRVCPISKSVVSYHLGILQDTLWVMYEKSGRRKYWYIVGDTVVNVVTMLRLHLLRQENQNAQA